MGNYIKFAIDFLQSQDSENADIIYSDSCLFFQNTFLTQNMRYIISHVLRRLSSGEGGPVLFLSAEFGGEGAREKSAKHDELKIYS